VSSWYCERVRGHYARLRGRGGERRCGVVCEWRIVGVDVGFVVHGIGSEFAPDWSTGCVCECV